MTQRERGGDKHERWLTACFQVGAVLYGDEPQGEDAGEADHGAAQQREHPRPVNEEVVELVPRPRRVQALVNVVQDVEHVRAVTVDARVRHRGRHVCCRVASRAAVKIASAASPACVNGEEPGEEPGARSPLVDGDDALVGAFEGDLELEKDLRRG